MRKEGQPRVLREANEVAKRAWESWEPDQQSIPDKGQTQHKDETVKTPYLYPTIEHLNKTINTLHKKRNKGDTDSQGNIYQVNDGLPGIFKGEEVDSRYDGHWNS